MSSEKIWSTDCVTPLKRLDYWRQVLRTVIEGIEFSAPTPDIAARLDLRELGALRLFHSEVCGAHSTVRTLRGTADEDMFELFYMRRGSWKVAYRSRKIAVKRDELILLDLRAPFEAAAGSNVDHICVRIPGTWLRHWLTNPEACVAKVIRVGDPWHVPLASALESALTQSDPTYSLFCATQITGALALAFGSVHTSSGRRRVLFLRALQIMADKLDKEVDVGAVADALSISPRYLHKLFASQKTTYGRELLRLRLDRGQAILQDRRFDELSVTQVAWRCGFCDASHFTKRFREQYHQTPRVFRSTHARNAPIEMESSRCCDHGVDA